MKFLKILNFAVFGIASMSFYIDASQHEDIYYGLPGQENFPIVKKVNRAINAMERNEIIFFDKKEYNDLVKHALENILTSINDIGKYICNVFDYIVEGIAQDACEFQEYAFEYAITDGPLKSSVDLTTINLTKKAEDLKNNTINFVDTMMECDEDLYSNNELKDGIEKSYNKSLEFFKQCDERGTTLQILQSLKTIFDSEQ